MFGVSGRIARLLQSRQDLAGRLGHHGTSVAPIPAHDQAQVSSRTTDLIPGDPDTVRVSHAGLAVMRGELIGRNHIFLQRSIRFGVDFGRVKGVDRQRSVDLDRFGIPIGVEVDPSPKPAHSRLVGLVEHGIGPNGDDLFGKLVLIVAPQPLARPINVQRLAAGQT